MTTTLLKHSLSDYFKPLRPAIPDALISLEHLNHIESAAKVMPSTLTSFFGFECPLGTPEARADFLVSAALNEVGAKVLGDDNHTTPLPHFLKPHPVWSQIQSFSRDWLAETSLLHRKVKNVWLEFDVDGNPGPIPVPSFFFGAEALYPNPASGEPVSYHWITENALKLVLSQDVPIAIERQLFKCLDCLPEGAYVFQVGMMLARKSDSIRVCIRNISPDQILAYLAQINWGGSLNELKAVLTQLSPLTEKISLDLDIGEEVGSKIGLECYLGKQPKFQPRWQSFLDYLVDMALCVPEKRKALLAYPGCTREKHNPELWSDHLLELSRALGSNHEIVFYRGLHHIKVVYQPDMPLQAKAYLSVRQTLLDNQFFNQFTTQINGLIWG